MEIVIKRRRRAEAPNYKICNCACCGFVVRSRDRIFSVDDRVYHAECLENMSAKNLLADFGVYEETGQELLVKLLDGFGGRRL